MNEYTRLVLFVEGSDDTRFVESVLFPLAQRTFTDIQIYEYAERKQSHVRGYISQIKYIPGWNYIFTADFDQGPCITGKKSQLMNQFSSLDSERILIIRRLIESWYLAGLNSDSCHELGIQEPRHTNDLTKKQFDDIIPRCKTRTRSEARTNFLIETLRRYDIPTARRKNASFNYAMEKHFTPPSPNPNP